MSLEQYCESLNRKQKIQCCIALITYAMPIWDEYAKDNELKYRDSVVGLNHVVASDILERCLKAVESELNKSFFSKYFSTSLLSRNLHEFYEPKTAMQDLDWELPYPVAQLFYSVFNLMQFVDDEKKYEPHKDLAYVSMNQSIDALESSGLKTMEEIKAILDSYK